jgi:DNA-binding NtrC family response regulator
MASPEVCIVVIEDDHNISDLVAMYLRRDGFQVLQADDVEAGLGMADDAEAGQGMRAAGRRFRRRRERDWGLGTT